MKLKLNDIKLELDQDDFSLNGDVPSMVQVLHEVISVLGTRAQSTRSHQRSVILRNKRPQ